MAKRTNIVEQIGIYTSDLRYIVTRKGPDPRRPDSTTQHDVIAAIVGTEDDDGTQLPGVIWQTAVCDWVSVSTDAPSQFPAGKRVMPMLITAASIDERERAAAIRRARDAQWF
jgi:hypothetical protein